MKKDIWVKNILYFSVSYFFVLFLGLNSYTVSVPYDHNLLQKLYKMNGCLPISICNITVSECKPI